MNSNTVLMYLLRIVLSYVAISGSYHIAKWYVSEYRLKIDKKASIVEMIFNCLCAVVISFGIASMVGMNQKINTSLLNPLTVAVFISISIPSVWGMVTSYEQDMKLTPEKKNIKRMLKKHEEKQMEERGAYSEL